MTRHLEFEADDESGKSGAGRPIGKLMPEIDFEKVVLNKQQ